MSLKAGCPCLLRYLCLDVLGSCLLRLYIVRVLLLVALDGWGWRELKVLPVSWFDGLARKPSEVAENGVWPEGLLDAYIAIIRKAVVDATPLGQRPLRQLEDWFRSWVPDSVFSAGGGRSLLKLGTLLRLILKRSFLVLSSLCS